MTDRPEAAALFDAVRDPNREFDAIVVGEFERAFYGDQLQQLMPVFDRYGVQLWLPETDGPLDLNDVTHQALMLLLGAQSRREVLRSRHRVTAAMRAQACEQGRYLGGRPPYGYRLVDAGPHPNHTHAQWGRRLRRLDPDPGTAQHVRWMFAQRLAGWSVAGIARTLNEKGVPCPSHVDPERNSHRSGEVWTLRTVAAILANPRYTGRQVWNRQGRDHEAARGKQRRGPVHRWNPVQDWVISKQIVHPPLVAERDFVAAQAIRAARPTEMAPPVCTDWPGWCAADRAVGGWTPTGSTTGPATAAATATPALNERFPSGRRTSTSARTTSSPASPPISPSWSWTMGWVPKSGGVATVGNVEILLN